MQFKLYILQVNIAAEKYETLDTGFLFQIFGMGGTSYHRGGMVRDALATYHQL